MQELVVLIIVIGLLGAALLYSYADQSDKEDEG